MRRGAGKSLGFDLVAWRARIPGGTGTIFVRRIGCDPSGSVEFVCGVKTRIMQVSMRVDSLNVLN